MPKGVKYVRTMHPEDCLATYDRLGRNVDRGGLRTVHGLRHASSAIGHQNLELYPVSSDISVENPNASKPDIAIQYGKRPSIWLKSEASALDNLFWHGGKTMLLRISTVNCSTTITASRPANAGCRSPRPPDNLTRFPIERARWRSVFPFLGLSAVATAGYGWTLQANTSIAAPLVMQFITGSTQTAVFSVGGTLLTDPNPGRSATVQASYNLVRCALSAAGVGALQAVIDGVGVGWCFTIYAVIGAFSVPFFLVLRRYGEEWRGMESIEGPSTTSNLSATEHEKPGEC